MPEADQWPDTGPAFEADVFEYAFGSVYAQANAGQITWQQALTSLTAHPKIVPEEFALLFRLQDLLSLYNLTPDNEALLIRMAIEACDNKYNEEDIRDMDLLVG